MQLQMSLTQLKPITTLILMMIFTEMVMDKEMTKRLIMPGSRTNQEIKDRPSSPFNTPETTHKTPRLQQC
jgi:hypothetical protein